MVKTIGISQRISVNIMEAAMKASLNGTFTPEFATDLAGLEFKGPNRIKKACFFIGHLTQRNPLFDYISNHRKEYAGAICYDGDRALIFTALINAAFEFGYDVTCIMGRYFHAQNEITSKLIVSQMAANYSNNRGLMNGLYCVLPMYIDAGFIDRPKIGVYKRKELNPVTAFSKEIYRQSFLIHNSFYTINDLGRIDHSYFEFL